MMSVEDKIQTMSGVSKRLFMALSSLRGTPPQVEDALFQMASVVDATSKFHFPGTNVTDRFVKYLDSVTTALYRIATTGRITIVDCTFKGTDGNQHTFGEIMYGIRCSSYHDPNEVDELVHWGQDNQFGSADGRFIINKPILMALFLMLISDDANRNTIDRELFTDDHFLKVNEVNYPIHLFIGDRPKLFACLGFAEAD